jgi:YegS/Rv2252/BmrU family lipid kinase
VTTAFVVGRRRKGGHVGGVVREVRATLERAGWKVDSAVVDQKSDLRRYARRAVKRDCHVVVVVGGDGAVNEVATALTGTPVALGIIPTGTGNLLAGNLGIPRRLDRAMETVLSGTGRRIDVGQATVGGKSHNFTVACGIGFDADVMDSTRRRSKRRWGKLAYFVSAIAASGRIGNMTHEITLDGVTTETQAAQVIVANFGRMMAGLSPRRPVLPDDGLLEVIVVRASGPIPALPAAWEALRQTDLGDSSGGRAFRAQAREVRIATAQPRLVEIDGNVVGRTPVDVSILPAALSVIVPASRSGGDPRAAAIR